MHKVIAITLMNVFMLSTWWNSLPPVKAETASETASATTATSTEEFDHHHDHPHYESHPHPTTNDPKRLVTNRTSRVELPLPQEKDAFTFAIFGDRTGGPPEGIEILKKAVADVNLFEPDLVMTVGDMIQGYNETDSWMPQMREYKSVMDELLCPWFPVAGNHDVYYRGENPPPTEHDENYEMHFGPLWYAFKHKNCWFIVLYSDEGHPETGKKTFGDPQAQKMSPEQFEWLKQTLEKTAQADHVFVFLHHPRWLEGGYGDDWEKVHQALVAAGNVRIVFAGHIHRMRYDGPRDGIEYVTLATVGGEQRGLSEGAGYLHHYHVATVRKQQIALACLPVGDVMDVREITGSVSEDIGRIAGSPPTISKEPVVGKDGNSLKPAVVQYSNPASRAIEFEAHVESPDGRWAAHPDHAHGRIDPGQQGLVAISLERLQGEPYDQFAWPELVVRTDYLAEKARIAVRERRLTLPVKMELPKPPQPERDLALEVKEGNYLVVEDALLNVPDGPLTLECWCRGNRFGERVGLLTKTEQSEFGLFVSNGQAGFTIFLDGRYVKSHAEDSVLHVGDWHHLAGVYDGQEVRLYVDGKLLDRQQGSGKRQRNRLPLIIGGDVDSEGSAEDPFDGLIDSVRLSTVARYEGDSFSPQRRLTNDEETALLMNFDGFVGPLAYDESGQDAHGRRVGQPKLQPVE